MNSSDTYKPTIVIPAYNRAESLKRLLLSVNEAEYPDKDIQLIISVDGGAGEEVLQAVHEFSFSSGSVKVQRHKNNLGVRKHIIWCADLSKMYGSVIILEDDLVVGPSFYLYAQNALKFYDEEASVAGISLYSPRYNETARLPFEPLNTGYQAYFMKTGCSWGQAWTKKQWTEFKEWYDSMGDQDLSDKTELPENVKNWPDTSWKKYFNFYLIDKNRYVLYPFNSYSTNTGDHEGENLKFRGSLYQVPLNRSEKPFEISNFPQFSDSEIRYDAFMEAEGRVIEEWVGLSSDEFEIDLYGSKPLGLIQQKKMCITSKKGRNALTNYPLEYRPIEFNLKFRITQNKKALFMLYQSVDVEGEVLITKQYFKMAVYFSYFNFLTKSFSVRFFIEIFKKVFRIKT